MAGSFRYEVQELQKGLAELELREMHPLRVYRPTEQQLAIHQSQASENIVVGGKRAGKTIAVAMEFASRVLGVPIIGPNGPILKRFKKSTPKNPKLYWVIGLNIDHIGQTLYHRLFSPGLGCDFRIIKDKRTNQWRAFNPNTDRTRDEEAVLSPPLFGEDVIVPDSWHMESAAGNIFKSLRTKNGATICAYATTGDYPKQGDAVDGIWLDEDTANAEFLKEWQDRLSTRRGWFLWSVWPKVANEALIKTLERGKRHADDQNPPITIVQLVGSENPYSDKEGIAEMLSRMDDDDDEAHRDRGDIDAFISGRRMYDFGSNIHIIKPQPLEKPENIMQLLGKMLSEELRFPATWTRYLVIDPSHTRTACLFGVVPPKEWNGLEIGDRLLIEHELVVAKHTPAMFASALMPLTEGMKFEAFVMDQMAGRQTTIGADATVFQIYEEQLRIRGIQSRITKSGFMRGCNDKSLRRRNVRELLEPTELGWPRLLVSQKCRHLLKEFWSYRKKEVVDNNGKMVPIDDPINERVHDCMAAIEYLCAYILPRFRDGTAYVEPTASRGTGSLAYQSAQAMIKKLNQNKSFCHMGPGEAA